MNDLISKKALLKDIIKGCKCMPYLSDGRYIDEIINSQPTAYDVDKVVEKLEERAINHDRISLGLSNYEERHTQLKIADTYRQSKLIVKDGDKDA